MTVAIGWSKISRFLFVFRPKFLVIFFVLFFFAFLLAVDARATQVTLAWDQDTAPGVTGYKLHYGTQSRNYSLAVDAGNSTSYVLSTLQTGTTYYFAVTAYDAAGVESGYSNEVSYNVSADVTLPVVTSFIISSTGTSLTVPITAFTATDDVGVTGYMLTQTSSKPAAAASGWTATAPTSYTFSTGGTKTLYAWAKDAAGNVSDSVFDTIALTVNTQILWRNTSTGVNAVWYMNGVNQTGWGQPPTLADPNWTIAGTADFNGDGKPDILWRNVSTGVNAVWYMNGVNMTGVGQIPTVADPNWKIVGTGDFNNDGKPDILWRNTSTGVNAVWYMNGVNMTGVGQIPKVADVNWTITGTADFNGDGKPDILWRNTSTGVNAVWYMNGVNQTGWAQIPTVADPNWKIVGTGDSNNDGYADIIWRNSATGANMVWYMNGVNMTGSGQLPTLADPNWKIVGAY